MSEGHPADAALQALRRMQVPALEPQGEARRRRLALVTLDRSAGFRVGNRRVFSWFWLSAAALTLCGLGAAGLLLWGMKPAQPSAAALQGRSAASNAAPKPLAIETSMLKGSEVTTDLNSTVQLKTAFGARISVSGASQLRLAGEQTPAIERVELGRGSIKVKVPRLGAQRQFQVGTPDTLVIVHGTEFTVTVRSAPDGQTDTVVRVTSGHVEVRRKRQIDFLNAGAAWSSQGVDTTHDDADSKPGESGQASEAGSNSAAHSGKAAQSAPTSPNPSGTQSRAAEPSKKAKTGRLAQANALLASALEASRRGDDESAIERLDELLSRFPDSPLASNAKVERFRALKRLGRKKEAARAAQGYLKSDPDGLARDEARALGK